MEWLKLTAPDFKQSIKISRNLCIIPIACIQKQGEHLPFGSDIMLAESISIAATEVEPAVVFPAQPFFENAAPMPFPGAIAVRWEVSFSFLENLCEEICRNGFKKILLMNVHGGSKSFIHNFLRNSLKSPKSYILYAVNVGDLIPKEFEKQVIENHVGGHADETKTSLIMHIKGDWVKMENLPAEPGVSRERLKHLKPASSPLNWNANYPTHYAGDASLATAEKGKRLFDEAVKNLTDLISRIKEDEVSEKLFKEFNSQAFRG